MKYKDKVRRIRFYRKLVWDDRSWGNRSYHYEDDWSFAFYGPEFRYRYDPVPGIGGSGKTYVMRCYRHMRTTQELRWYYAHKDLVRIRGRRSPKQLPNWYDDIAHGRMEKGWKRSKKKRQWM